MVAAILTYSKVGPLKSPAQQPPLLADKKSAEASQSTQRKHTAKAHSESTQPSQKIIRAAEARRAEKIGRQWKPRAGEASHDLKKY